MYRPWVSTRELPYTALSVVWFLVCTYIVCVANSYMDTNNPSVRLPEEERKRLPDALIDLAYPIYKQSGLPIDLPDTLILVSIGLILIRVLLSGKLALTVLRRVLYVAGMVYLLRAPFIVMTALPNPLYSCKSTPNPNYFYDALFLMTQQRVSCGDVMYSGHTIIFMSSCLVWFDYPLFDSNLDRIFQLTSVLWGIFCHLILIISTYHYTVDIAVAIMVMLFFWKSFHYLATTTTFDHTLASRLVLFLDQERYSRPIEKPLPVQMSEV